MAKRPPSKTNARQRKASEDMADDNEPPLKKSRYNLRERPVKPVLDDAVWVDDDTLDTSDEEEDEEQAVHIEIEIRGLNLADSDGESDEDSFLKILQNKYTRLIILK
jgi:hypothetical protein